MDSTLQPFIPNTLEEYNSDLRAQIAKHNLNEKDLEKFSGLLIEISNSYDLFVQIRGILEKSVNESSKELLALNTKLQNDIRQSQKIQEELRELNERLTHHTDNTPLAILECNKDLEIIYWNNRATEMFSQQPEKILHKNILTSDLIHPEDIPAVREAAKRLLSGEASRQKNIVRIKSTTGHYLTCELYHSAIYDDNGEVATFLSFASNITESIISQQKLRESEANLNAIINNTENAIFSIDKNYRVVTFNNATYEASYAVTGKEMKTGDPFFTDLAGEEMMLQWKGYLTRALSGEKFQVETFQFLNGRITEVEMSFNPILEKGEVIGVGCFGRDITEEKSHAAKLQASERRFRSLIENSQDMLALINATQKLEYISPSIERDFGYSLEMIANVDMLNLVHPDDIKNAATRLAISLKNHATPVKCQLRARRSNGTYSWLEGTITNMLAVESVKSVVINFRDITDKRENESLLVESEKKYRNLFEYSPMPMWIIDDSSDTFLNANHAAINLYGYSKQEFLKLPKTSLLQTSELRTYLGSIDQEETGFYKAGIWNHTKKDGSCITVETHSGLIEFEGRNATLVIANDISEKYKTEQELQENIERYNLVTRATNDAIWDWNLQTEQLYWSQGYEKLFGYPANNNIANYLSWKNNIHPGDLNRVLSGLNKALESPEEGYWEDEYRYLKADGTIAHIYDRGYVIYDNNKRALRMVGAMQDITKRKTAEEYLHKSETNLRNILENTDTAYILLDENAAVLSYNHKAIDIAECELISPLHVGKNYIELLRPERQSDVHRAMHNVLKIGEQVEYEVRSHDPVKGDKWVQVSMHPILNDDKIILGLSVALNDITKRKTSERLLRKSEANLRAMFDNTDNAYVLLDRNLKVLSYNHQANDYYKKEVQLELTEGLEFIDHLPADNELDADAIYKNALTGEKHFYENCIRLENGVRHWFHISVLPVFDDRQKVLAVMIGIQNISQRKSNELEKEKMTLELMQRNQDLEQFAYIISHNLRAPVANITGLSNIINSVKVSAADHKRCMEGLTLSVKKLDDVIIDLNYILQVRREISERKENIKFQDLIDDIKTSINNIITKENVEIITDFSKIPGLFTLKSYMNSIFYNLILNSIKYRRADVKPVISITTSGTKNNLALTFTDNGLGIDLETNGGKVFGLYKKFHAHIDGKGMGLYMVKTQTEILGGKIFIDSEVNSGTTFTIIFGKKEQIN